jgi:NADPH:quinone reductase-like Zn-dependent oxidoreductase
VTLSEFGLGNLRVEERPAERLGKFDVRIAVDTVALNYRDALIVRGRYDTGMALPLIPCSDGAGVVLECGDGVTDFELGQKVCTHMTPEWGDGRFDSRMRLTTLGGPADGVLSEERVLPREAIVPIPEAISTEDAACLPVAGLTAWNALRTVADIKAGDRVLVLGTGGVSLMTLQLAKMLGAQVAITSSSDEKLERVRALGADFTANYLREPWAERVREWSDGGVDLVMEIGGDGTFDQSVFAARDGGCVALLGVLARRGKPVNLTELLLRRIRVEGVFVGSRVELEDLIAFVRDQAFRPTIDREFEGLATTRQAFAHLISGKHVGKVVIRVGD